VFDSLARFGHAIMSPLYVVISAVLVGCHVVFAKILPDATGWAWALSIVTLTVVVRAALIPLFVKQIKASRNMQLLQPKVRELQKKYGHDRERLAQETMNLYRDEKTNPLASCFPLLIQMPIFFALFGVLRSAAKGVGRGRFLTDEKAQSLGRGEIFGVQIADSFTQADGTGTYVLAGFLVVSMTVTTFLTQRQLMSKNMPVDAMTGPYAKQQKMLLYVLPPVFAIGGFAFPIGVLLYWTTSNLWTMGQQFYVIRRNPAPGTPAFKAKQERDTRKGRVVDGPEGDGGGLDTRPSPIGPEQPSPRRQPKKQSREERKKRRPPGATRAAEEQS
jgi:YidC/Oxa1 family membrane protein insertase